MYICLCLSVTTSTVQQAIDAGARSTKQVAEACGAGSVCGRCNHTIRTMIEAAAPDPPSGKPDRLRRRWGRGHVRNPTQLPHPTRSPPTSPAHPPPLPPPRRAFMIVDSFDRIATETVHDHGVPPEGVR